jgi:hypothetical protein
VGRPLHILASLPSDKVSCNRWIKGLSWSLSLIGTEVSHRVCILTSLLVTGVSKEFIHQMHWSSENVGSFVHSISCKKIEAVWIWDLYSAKTDRLYGLVVRVPACADPEVPGSFPGRYQIFWVVVGLERSPLSLVSTIEELLGRNSSGSCLENRE